MQTELNLSSDKRETKMEEQFTAHVTRNDTPIQRTNLPVDHTVSVSQCELGPDAQHGYADHSSRNDEVVYSASEPCLLYTSPSPRDRQKSRMPSSA